MKKGLFLIAISLLFVACTPKNSAFRYFDKGDIETNAVRNTKKADIIKDDAIEATLMATYLNKFDPKISQKEENFLVYIYFPNLEEQIDFSKNGYELLLNGKTPISIEKLERDDKYADTDAIKASKRMLLSAGVELIQLDHKIKLGLEIK